MLKATSFTCVSQDVLKPNNRSRRNGEMLFLMAILMRALNNGAYRNKPPDLVPLLWAPPFLKDPQVDI